LSHLADQPEKLHAELERRSAESAAQNLIGSARLAERRKALDALKGSNPEAYAKEMEAIRSI
ncbi:MAG TPA: hypothetical protein PK011_14825, partial [Marinagarivorans sp.]|nr:hypothetical protein [Marinagarivorans sp.]